MNSYLNKYGQSIYFYELGERLYNNFYVFTAQGRVRIQTERYEIVIPPIYQEIKPAFLHHFWGKLNDRWRLYNFEDQQIGSHHFHSVRTFKLDFAAISDDGKY